jgi:hypothetical protein
MNESQDSGELAACAATLGITHPTGYPLYTLLGWAAIRMSGMDPARTMVLLSCLFGTVAAILIAAISARVIAFLDKNGSLNRWIVAWWGAVAAGFAVIHPLMWSQSVVCEVYSLALLLQTITWLLILNFLEAYRNSDEKSLNRLSVLLGLVVGLILAHQIGGASIVIAMGVIAFFVRLRFFIRRLLLFVTGLVPGPFFYAYLPIRSAQNPVLDWGNPQTWPNFWHHVTAWQYRRYIFGTPYNDIFIRLNAFPWEKYWGVGGCVLIILGLIVLITGRDKAVRSLGLGSLVFIIWTIAFAIGYWVTDFDTFYYPLLVPSILLIASGLGVLAIWLVRRSKILTLLLALVLVVSLVFEARNRWVDMDVSDPMLNSAALFASRAVRVLPDDTLLITFTDGNCLSMTYAVTCGIIDPSTGERLPPRPDVDLVVANWVVEDWFRENVRDRWAVDGHLRLVFPSHEREQALRALVDQNIAHRPVYVDGFVLDQLQGPHVHYESEAHGPLFRIVPEK